MDHRSSILLILVLGTMMAAVDTTIVVLALPTIVQDLHSDLYVAVWTIIIYLLVVAVLTTQLGRIGDSLGRGKMFNVGFLIFTLGSALCGAAPTAESLVAFRAIQALGGALMQANSGAIVADVFPPNERGRAFGFTSMGWNVGATLGIVLGGVITTFLGWRFIFYINVPIGIVSVVLGFRRIRTQQSNGRGNGVDVPGFTLLLLSLGLITYGASDVAGEGVTILNSSLMGIGLILLIPLLYAERRVSNPLIDLRAFSNRVLTFSLLASFFQSAGALSVAFLLIMYLQGIRGLDPLKASLLLVPGYVLSSLIAPRAGRLSDKYGARVIATLGLALMITSVSFYLFLTPSTSFLYIVLASVVNGIGAAMFYPANTSAVMANASAGFYGGASGLLRTFANIGTLLSYVIAISVSSIAVPRYVAFEVFLGTTKLIGGVGQEFLQGIHVTFLVSISLLVISALMSASRGKEERRGITLRAQQESRTSESS